MTEAIAQCRDVDPTRLQERFPDLKVPPVYPGSIAGVCVGPGCGVAVWIGPRQQQAIEDLGDVKIMCIICATDVAVADPFGTAIGHLGNPWKPKAGTE